MIATSNLVHPPHLRAEGELVNSESSPSQLQGGTMPVRDYQIRVTGEFGRRHRMAFEDLDVTVSQGQTVLCGRLPDQAALYGVLRRLEDLGLEIVDIRSAVAIAGPSQSG